MSLTRNIQLDARHNLAKLLDQTKALVNSSKESAYSSFSPEEIATDLSIGVEALHKGDKLDIDQLRMHFSPTGSIQETAMESTWTDEYMSISEQFDAAIEKIQ